MAVRFVLTTPLSYHIICLIRTFPLRVLVLSTRSTLIFLASILALTN